MTNQITNDCPITKQLNHILDGLSVVEHTGLATLIQNLRVMGFGNLHLVDAILAGKIWETDFTVSLPFKKEVLLAKLRFIATYDSCLIGNELRVDDIHENFHNRGVVV